MLAGQGDCVESHEAGPTAAANLIEDLGEFDLFDRILAAAETKLSGVRCDPDRPHRTAQVQLDDIHIGWTPPCGTPDARHWTRKAKVEDMIRTTSPPAQHWTTQRRRNTGWSFQAIKAIGYCRDPCLGQAAYQHRLRLDRAKIFPTAQLRTESTEALSQQIAGAGEAEKVRALHGRFVDASSTMLRGLNRSLWMGRSRTSALRTLPPVLQSARQWGGTTGNRSRSLLSAW